MGGCCEKREKEKPVDMEPTYSHNTYLENMFGITFCPEITNEVPYILEKLIHDGMENNYKIFRDPIPIKSDEKQEQKRPIEGNEDNEKQEPNTPIVYHTCHEQKYKCVKVFTCEINNETPKMIARKEIEYFKRYNHPQILKMTHYQEQGLKYFLNFEDADKTLLEEMKTKYTEDKAKFYSEKEIAIIMQQIFSVISYLHSQGAVHRDIKPENFVYSTSELFPLRLRLAAMGTLVEDDRLFKYSKLFIINKKWCRIL